MRIATVHLVLDVESDDEACDFCSETFGNMPYVFDWGHARPIVYGHPLEEVTKPFLPRADYVEGDFLLALRGVSPDESTGVDPMGPETDRGGLLGQQPY